MSLNTASLLERARYRYADRTALIFGDRRWTYTEMDRDVNALAAGLRAHGIGRGDRVAVLAMNSPEYLFLGVALAKLAAVMVPLNYRVHERELLYMAGHSRAVAVAGESAFAGTAEALAALPGIRLCLDLDALDLSSRGGGWVSVPGLIASHRGQRIADEDVAPDELQRVLYTSGTTSRPKGARLTHGNVNANIDVQVVELALTAQDRILNFAPLYHVGGLDLPGYAIWFVGAAMVLLRKFDAESIMETVEAERITGMTMVATMVHMIARTPSSRSRDTSTVKWLIFSQVNPTLFEATRQIFPNAALMEGYGLTETCSALTYLDMDHMQAKTGSAGRPVPWVELRVVDESGRSVPTGEVGEIVARGAKVADGYLDDPEATSQAFRDGWFHTGDVGRLDDDGYLYILDRLKDMIRSGGENVASSEIETVIYEVPGVQEAAVIGVPHSRWVEVPAAFVLAGPGFDPAAMIAACRARLGGFKVPKAVFVIDEMPRNPTGKVLKRELRARLGAMSPTWVDVREAEFLSLPNVEATQ